MGPTEPAQLSLDQESFDDLMAPKVDKIDERLQAMETALKNRTSELEQAIDDLESLQQKAADPIQRAELIQTLVEQDLRVVFKDAIAAGYKPTDAEMDEMAKDKDQGLTEEVETFTPLRLAWYKAELAFLRAELERIQRINSMPPRS